MISEFQKRKMALAFYKFDSSKDGVVEQSDFELYGKKVAEYMGLKAGSAAYQETVKRASGIWDAYFKAADRNGNGQVTLDEYIKSNSQFLSHTGAVGMAVEANKALFGALDTDGSGHIQLNEFKAFVVPMGVTESEAVAAFSKLDLDGSGQITRDEFAKNLADYYTSNDPGAAGNWFYGSF